MIPKRIRQRLVATAGYALLTTLLVGLLFQSQPVRNLEYASYDLRLRAEARLRPVPQDPRILLLTIDDKSFEQFGRWPWPRLYWTGVTDSLVELGARAVFFDINFPEPTESRVQGELGGASFDTALRVTAGLMREQLSGPGLAARLEQWKIAPSEDSKRTVEAVGTAVGEGIRNLEETLRQFAVSPDGLVGECLAAARARGVPCTGVLTIKAPRRRPDADRELERQLKEQLRKNPGLDVELDLADPGLRAFAREAHLDVRQALIEEAGASELAALGPAADALDTAQFRRRPALAWLDAFQRVAGTLLDHVLARHALRSSALELPGAERLPNLRSGPEYTPPVHAIARGFARVGADNAPKDEDGSVRSLPTVWRVGDRLVPGAGLATLLAVAPGAPAPRLEAGPALELSVPAPDGTLRRIRAPVSPRGDCLIHWSGPFDRTFSNLRIDQVLVHAELRRQREEYFLNRLHSVQYAQTRLFRALVRTLSVRAPASAVSLDELAAQARARWPSVPFHPEEYLVPGPLALPATTAAKVPTEWHAYFVAMLAQMEEGALTADRFFLKKAAGYKDPEKRRAAEARLAERADEVRRYDTRLAALTAALKAQLAGRICLIGHSADSTTDLMAMPFSGSYPGVGAHANLINTFLSERFLVRPPGLAWSLGGLIDPAALQLPLLLVVALAMAFALPSLNAVRGALCAAGFVVAWIAFTTALLMYTGQWVDMVSPILATLCAYLCVFTWRTRSTEWVRNMFESYVDPRIVGVLMENRELWTELGGREQTITAFFSDIAGFTTLSELLTPHELSEMLTDYLSPMTDTILAHDGTRDKYIGDAIVAFFGAPLPTPGHALSACLSSVRQQELLVELKKTWLVTNRGWYTKILAAGHDLTFRIGLNTGPAKVGNFGSQKSKNYTMIGDTVNLASRLEGANKEYGSLIMASEATVCAAGDGVIVRTLDKLVVKGKLEAVTVYEILGRRGATDRVWDEVLPLYEQGVALYLARKFAEAITRFEQVLARRPGDGPSRLYVERCRAFQAEPPPADWNGAYVMTHK